MTSTSSGHQSKVGLHTWGRCYRVVLWKSCSELPAPVGLERLQCVCIVIRGARGNASKLLALPENCIVMFQRAPHVTKESCDASVYEPTEMTLFHLMRHKLKPSCSIGWEGEIPAGQRSACCLNAALYGAPTHTPYNSHPKRVKISPSPPLEAPSLTLAQWAPMCVVYTLPAHYTTLHSTLHYTKLLPNQDLEWWKINTFRGWWRLMHLSMADAS